LEQWGREIWENDPWGRAFAGLPTDSSGDFAWVQHMVKSMAEGKGRMAVVLPQGALFRGGVEGQIRQYLLEQDWVETVIGLAPNLFYGTGLAACILILKKKKSLSGKESADRGCVIFIPQGTRAELPRPGTRRPNLGWVQEIRRCQRPGAGGFAGRDQEGRRLDVEHLALCAAAHRGRHPAFGCGD
jgi:hypothetical protein